MLLLLKSIQEKTRFKRTLCVSLKRRMINDVSRVSTLKRCNGVSTPFKKYMNSGHPDIFGPPCDCLNCGGTGCQYC